MIIDSHCHLDYEPLINNINDVLLNAKKNNITNLLTIGTSFESSVPKYRSSFSIRRPATACEARRAHPSVDA